MGVHNEVLNGPAGPLARIWAASCDSPTGFSSLASVTPGFGFARIGGTTTVHVRGPMTAAAPLHCPADAEFFGADFRLGTYLPMFPRARLTNGRDHLLPTLPDGRILLDGREWEMPTPHTVDVFVDRLVRTGLLVVDPLVEELRHGAVRGVPERTAHLRRFCAGVVGPLGRPVQRPHERAAEVRRLDDPHRSDVEQHHRHQQRPRRHGAGTQGTAGR